MENTNKKTEQIGCVSVLFNCKSLTKFNIRPIATVSGKLLEWQLILVENSSLDFMAISKKEKPQPGLPVMGENVLRFHPDDVMVNQEPGMGKFNIDW